MSVFRIYEPRELGADGYPLVWHEGFKFWETPVYGDPLDRSKPVSESNPLEILSWRMVVVPPGAMAGPVDENATFPMFGGVKDLVRAEAGNRCIRCLHPYVAQSSANVWAEEQVEHFVGHTLTSTGHLFDDLPEEIEQRSGLKVGAPIPGTKQVLYSPCDERCRHGGPARARVTSDRPWEVRQEVEPELLARQVAQDIEVQAAWRILTVHHLNGRKHDLRWWNLVSLCQRCHLHIQKKVVMERVWPYEHSDWFKVYAAGWYAYAYLGEELSRDETMARLDELLALERAA